MADALLLARGLSYRWPGQAPLFQALNLQLKRGEVLALLGPNGCGKSTLMRLLLGTLVLQQGTVERRAETGFVPQTFTPPFDYQARDIVLMGRARHIGLFRAPSRRDQQQAEEAMATLEIQELAARTFGTLSGGQRQRVLIARALASASDIIILDEPTSALDLHHQDRVLTLIRRLAEQRNMAVMFSTHQPAHACAVADNTLLLGHEGQHHLGACDEVLTSGRLSALFQLPIERISLETNGQRHSTLVPLYHSQRKEHD
jgi:iron complex transport system ATP-binding protein